MADPVIEDTDAPENPTTEYSFSPDTPFQGQISELYDRDWVAMDAEAGEVYLFTVTGQGEDPLERPGLTIYDADRNFLGGSWGYYYDSEPDGTAEAYVVFETDDTYFASVSGGYDETGGYELTVEIAEFEGEIPADTSTEAVLEVGTTIRGIVDYPSDRDWFALEVVAGQIYEITLKRAGDDPVGDPYLTLFDADGTSIRSNDDYMSLDSRLVYVADESATLYVEARDLGSRVGEYDLSALLLELPDDDVPGDVTTDATLAVNSSVDGTIDLDFDQDWYRVSMSAGESYFFTVGPDLGSETPINAPGVTLFDEAGEEVARGEYDYTTDSYGLDFHSEGGGTYFAAVSASRYDSYYYYGSSSEGDYVLFFGENLKEAGDAPADTSTPYEMFPGAEFRGAIGEPGGEDWVAVTVEAGQHYRFAALSRTPENGLPDPEIVIRDADGKPIAGNDDGQNTLDAGLVWAMDTGGTVYVSVASSSAAPDDTGRYLLTVDTVNARYSVSGSDGDDYLNGAYGSDNLYGSAGADTLIGNDERNTLSGGNGRDLLEGNGGRDDLYGGGGRDVLKGGEGRDFLYGHGGNDVLRGGAHGDRLYGGGGDDTLQGGSGDDRLDGDKGGNLLTGGGGEDRFVLQTGTSTVTDFELGVDILELNAYSLWGQRDFTVEEVLDRWGSVDGSDVVLEFKLRGTIVLEGVTDLDALAGSIEIA